MKVMVIPRPGMMEVQEVPTPKPGPYQALVKTEVMALCNSTDRKLVEGHFPGMEKYPMALGHEDAGIVVEIGEKVTQFKPGDRVIGGMVSDFGDTGISSGWGGFSEYVIVHDHDAMVRDGVADAEHGWFDSCEIQRAVPEGISADAGALLCTWREVYGGIGDFSIQPKDKILIYGAGPVGMSFVKFTKLMGVKWVGLVDPLPNKRARALEMGADAVFAPEEVNFPASTFDVIVDAVGSEKIVNAAIPMIKLGGTIGVYGVISQPVLTVEKGKGPYNFNLIIHQWPTRWRERLAMEPICQWIKEGKLSADEFVTHRFNIADLDKALAAVKAGEALKVLMTF
ncbi:MAG: alcohol dehydrogenase catalytic domain-containing protein [Kiritimatiellae bacterium]|nr:alcohol dehydrogenase catalytic domain-containing protein [Kiritimatiellia bacterium]MBP5228484.1 alcohol dehydrogenase catalytic domain-containing protein [Kiritimatiellia bacterium]